MSRTTLAIGGIVANWKAKREKTSVDQKKEQAEAQQWTDRQQAYLALLDSERNLKTQLGRPPTWEEWANEYTARLSAWAALWTGGEVDEIQNLPPLSQEEEQIHPGITEARSIAVHLLTLAHQGAQKEVRNLLDHLRDDHLADDRSRDHIRELRRLVVIWLHGRLEDALTINKAERPPGSMEPATTKVMPVMCLGDRNYRIGETLLVVDDSEETILQAFFADARLQAKWISLSYKELRRRTNIESSPRILKKMRTKYRELGPAIECPGKKGRGGLKVHLIKAKKNRVKSS
jgi:hypothetical protein